MTQEHTAPTTPLADALADALVGVPATLPLTDIVHDLLIPAIKRAFATDPVAALDAIDWIIDAQYPLDHLGAVFIAMPPVPLDVDCAYCGLTYLDVTERMVTDDHGAVAHVSCVDAGDSTAAPAPASAPEPEGVNA